MLQNLPILGARPAVNKRLAAQARQKIFLCAFPVCNRGWAGPIYVAKVCPPARALHDVTGQPESDYSAACDGHLGGGGDTRAQLYKTTLKELSPSLRVLDFDISGDTMAEQFQPTSVKDVPKDKFISAYAEHLKANDKV